MLPSQISTSLILLKNILRLRNSIFIVLLIVIYINFLAIYKAFRNIFYKKHFRNAKKTPLYILSFFRGILEWSNESSLDTKLDFLTLA